MVLTKNLGQIAFEAHCAHGGGQHVYGRTITDWNALSPMIKEAWYQASLAVIETVWKDRHVVGTSGIDYSQGITVS